ncbi:MAG: carboxypeptidase regulatory-like domain-containing protein [Bryobacteraceae bacterium]
MSIRRLVLIALLGVPAWAQTFRGNLTGAVTDSSGAALPQAVVQLINPETGLTRTSTTTGGGEYNFPDLPLGVYAITVSHSGFETKKISNIEIAVSKTTNISIQLGVATQQQMVEVSAAAVNLETTSSELVSVVNDKTVQDLPINGRDFTQMIKLSPGVTTGLVSSINGMRPSGNNFQIDGADNNDVMQNIEAVNQPGVGGIAGALLPIDAIDQFSVQTNAAADVGRNAGSNINLVVKSGTNSLHGTLYFFDRNEALASPSPTQPPGSSPQEIRNNQFGFSIGGPIFKNKTFFFLTGEAQIGVVADSIIDTSPSAAWVTKAQGVLANSHVPVNPVSLNLLTIFPANSRTGPATPNNYLANGLNTFNSYNGIVKVDHRFNDKHSLSLRYLGGTGTQVGDVGSHFVDFFQVAPIHVHNFSLVETAILSPRLVSQLTLGVNYFLQTFNDFNIGFNPLALGLNTGITQGNQIGSPTINIGGFDSVGVSQPTGRIDTTGHITENLSYSAGRHQFKFGGEYRRAVLDVAYFAKVRGVFTFDGTRGPWASDPALSGTLKALADFLAGYPSNSNGAVIARGEPEPIFQINSGDWWVHDNFQVSPQLNVNFGVRYDYYGVLHDKANDLANFLPGKGFVTGQLYPKNKLDFAPRFGFAYSPKWAGKIAIRGGYGIYYDVPIVNAFDVVPAPNGAALGISFNPGGPNPVYTLSATNVVFQPGVPVFGGVAPIPPFGAFSVSQDFRLPYAQNYHLDVQTQLTRTTLFQVGYVGDVGRHLLAVLDINQAIHGIRPYAGQYPLLGAIDQLNSIANSSYNSLQTSLRQRLWKGLTANLNYTWSHAIDNASGATTPENSYNLNQDRGSSSFDTRHIETGFISYEAPRLENFAPRLTGGWQFNALVTYTSGSPINVLAGTNVSGSGENKDRPNLVGDPFANVPVLTGTQAVQYFNPSAFARPATGTFGNLGRDAFYGPGFGSVDFSVFKRTPITERVNTEFRVEIFNLLNRTNWANPVPRLVSASFGQLTGTKASGYAPGIGFGEPRNVQLGFKIIF